MAGKQGKNPKSLANLRPNFNGRKNAKAKLTGKFLRDLHDFYKENGVRVITEAAAKDPVAMVKVWASFVEKEVKIDVRTKDVREMSLDELNELINAELARRASGAEETPDGADQPGGIH